MQEADIGTIKNKVISGVVALTTRSFILQFVTFVSTFILTILLTPSVFGIFFVVSAVISFLSYFSDVGLAAALIQKKEEPTYEELVSVFTLQQILVGSLVIIFFIISPFFANYYNLSYEGVFLLRALLLSFFLSSLKTIPSILLERKLEFSLLVIPQIIESLTFYFIAIGFALMGFGLLSFAWAAIARGVVGLVAIYYIRPWNLSVGISTSSMKRLLTFGIPFQANSLLALIKDDLMIIFLGKILPFYQVGYIGWAKKWAEAPLRLIMDSVIRVTFPALSRLQGDKIIFGRAIEKSFLFLSLFIFPTTAILILYMKPLVFLIPKYSKWEPALFPFYLFAFSALMAAFSSPLVNALNAIGKIKTTLLLMIVWTLLTWILVPSLTIALGFVGIALAAFVISFTSVIPIVMIRKEVHVALLASVVKPALITVIVFLPIYFILLINHNLIILVISLLFSIGLYILVVWLWMRNEIGPYFLKFFKIK